MIYNVRTVKIIIISDNFCRYSFKSIDIDPIYRFIHERLTSHMMRGQSKDKIVSRSVKTSKENKTIKTMMLHRMTMKA